MPSSTSGDPDAPASASDAAMIADWADSPAWSGLADVPNWDSFTYINFIAAVEMELGIRFKIADVESFEDVGAIVRCVQQMKSG
mgnify:CR=1 FL=1